VLVSLFYLGYRLFMCTIGVLCSVLDSCEVNVVLFVLFGLLMLWMW